MELELRVGGLDSGERAIMSAVMPSARGDHVLSSGSEEREADKTAGSTTNGPTTEQAPTSITLEYC